MTAHDFIMSLFQPIGSQVDSKPAVCVFFECSIDMKGYILRWWGSFVYLRNFCTLFLGAFMLLASAR